MLYNVGTRIVHSDHGLLATVAYKLGKRQVHSTLNVEHLNIENSTGGMQIYNGRASL
jgi:glycerol kinase